MMNFHSPSSRQANAGKEESSSPKGAPNKKAIRFAAQFARIRMLIRDFHLSTRGNTAVLCAVLALPMVSAVGCAIDYSMATMIRTKLQAAADAATLATVSTNSPVTVTAQSMSGTGSVSGGSTFALNFLNADLTNVSGYTNLSTSASVTKTGTQVTATVSFTASVPTFFMGVVGYNNVSVSGSSSASVGMPTYINFYLMIDVSGSIAFPSTASEQSRLAAVNPDNYTLYPKGCVFACHFAMQGACPQSSQGSIPAAGHSYSGYIPNPNPGGYCQGFTITRLGTTPASGSLNGNNVNWTNTPVSTCPTAGTTACIQLQADAVGYAVTQLLSTAYNSEQVASQYKIGLYPFIDDLYSYFPLTATLNGSATTSGTINYAAANLATLLDTGQNVSLQAGGTHFENAFPSMNNLITSVGTGSSSSNALPYVFVITDGVEDNQSYWNGNWSSTQTISTLNPSLCTTLKQRGITIAILYLPYQPIQNPTDFSCDEDYDVNAIIPDIPAALQSCASPNFFYTASSPAAITSGLQQMFAQAVSTAHISN